MVKQHHSPCRSYWYKRGWIILWCDHSSLLYTNTTCYALITTRYISWVWNLVFSYIYYFGPYFIDDVAKSNLHISKWINTILTILRLNLYLKTLKDLNIYMLNRFYYCFSWKITCPMRKSIKISGKILPHLIFIINPIVNFFFEREIYHALLIKPIHVILDKRTYGWRNIFHPHQEIWNTKSMFC